MLRSAFRQQNETRKVRRFKPALISVLSSLTKIWKYNRGRALLTLKTKNKKKIEL